LQFTSLSILWRSLKKVFVSKLGGVRILLVVLYWLLSVRSWDSNPDLDVHQCISSYLINQNLLNFQVVLSSTVLKALSTNQKKPYYSFKFQRSYITPINNNSCAQLSFKLFKLFITKKPLKLPSSCSLHIDTTSHGWVMMMSNFQTTLNHLHTGSISHTGLGQFLMSNYWFHGFQFFSIVFHRHCIFFTLCTSEFSCTFPPSWCYIIIAIDTEDWFSVWNLGKK
jgi:hypothetical protein